MKQLNRTKVRKPSLSKRIPIFLRLVELRKKEAMRKNIAITGSARSSKYMMLKLLRKEEEIYKQDKLEGKGVT